MPKNMTLRIEFARENPVSRGYFYSYLDLPAEEHEIRDALQKARCTLDKDGGYEISISECPYLYDLTDTRLDSPSIDELNFFAKRLSQMDDCERAIFGAVAPKVLARSESEPVSMRDLINCTYGLDEVMVAANVTNDTQLGQFIIENEIHDDVNAIPEQSLYLLDRRKIGELYRTVSGCRYLNGYAVFAGDYEMPAVYDGKQLPEMEHSEWFAFRLKIAGEVPDRTDEKDEFAEWVSLPMEEHTAEALAEKYGAAHIGNCGLVGFESSVPQIESRHFIDMHDFDKLNALAYRMLEMSPTEQIKFKAVLEAERPYNLDGITDIANNLHQYQFNAMTDDEGSFFKTYLRANLAVGFDPEWLDTLHAYNEGVTLLDRLGATMTDYGVVSARGRTLYELVPYNKLDADELKTQQFTDEKLEVVEVLGQTALFSNGRVTEQELPEGLYKYELSEGESLSFSSIEPNVSVNFGGTIITKAPLDFGGQEYFVFSEDTTPNFLGYDLTPKEFMETDFTQTEEEDQTEDEDESIRMGGMQI